MGKNVFSSEEKAYAVHLVTAKGMTQKEAAQQIGCDQATVSKWIAEAHPERKRQRHSRFSNITKAYAVSLVMEGGHKQSDAAKAVGCSAAAVGKWMNLMKQETPCLTGQSLQVGKRQIENDHLDEINRRLAEAAFEENPFDDVEFIDGFSLDKLPVEVGTKIVAAPARPIVRNNHLPECTIYVKGSWQPFLEIGGWAFTIRDSHTKRQFSRMGRLTNSSPYGGELTAILEGLRILDRPMGIRLVSANGAVMSDFNYNLPGWIKNGFLRDVGREIPDEAKWREIWELAHGHQIFTSKPLYEDLFELEYCRRSIRRLYSAFEQKPELTSSVR